MSVRPYICMHIFNKGVITIFIYSLVVFSSLKVTLVIKEYNRLN